MAEKMTVHLFKCTQESSSYLIYGLTTDKTGKNLPPTECPTGWIFDKTETVTEGGTRQHRPKYQRRIRRPLESRLPFGSYFHWGGAQRLKVPSSPA
jgi:hypothetical protein